MKLWIGALKCNWWIRCLLLFLKLYKVAILNMCLCTLYLSYVDYSYWEIFSFLLLVQFASCKSSNVDQMCVCRYVYICVYVAYIYYVDVHICLCRSITDMYLDMYPVILHAPILNREVLYYRNARIEIIVCKPRVINILMYDKLLKKCSCCNNTLKVKTDSICIKPKHFAHTKYIIPTTQFSWTQLLNVQASISMLWNVQRVHSLEYP